MSNDIHQQSISSANMRLLTLGILDCLVFINEHVEYNKVTAETYVKEPLTCTTVSINFLHTVLDPVTIMVLFERDQNNLITVYMCGYRCITTKCPN